jgi:hypothetical protein
MTEKLLIAGYYSFAHDSATCLNRINGFVADQKQKCPDSEYIGAFSDKDLQGHEKFREGIRQSLSDVYCIMIVLPGWAEATPMINILYEFKNIPIIVVALAGYYSKEGLIAPAAAAGASTLKNSLQSLGFKYFIKYQKIGEPVNSKAIAGFLDSARVSKQLCKSKIASFGYACSNLYPFMYDGNLIKRYTGIHVDNLDLLELEQIASAITEEDVSKFVLGFKNNVLFRSEVSITELNRQARYSLALDSIIEVNKYEAVTMKCNGGFGKLCNFTPCMLLSYIGNNIQAICECDVYNLALQTIIKKISSFPVTFLEVFEFYKNSILMASCGFAPPIVCKDGKISVFSHEWGGSGGLMNISELNAQAEVTILSLSASEGKLNIHYSKAKSKTPELFQEEGWEGRNGPKIPALEIDLAGNMENFTGNITGPHYLVVFGDISDEIENYAYLNGINILSNKNNSI